MAKANRSELLENLKGTFWMLDQMNPGAGGDLHALLTDLHDTASHFEALDPPPAPAAPEDGHTADQPA